ncbi:MAG: alpha-N-acetylglucosaminidase C-terminal domain-containing protein [Armatimonadetes bacterium]|nr:alpha-N-acetylglucosaminidase C-terminal domain-containing protein [Armatimonadota bacterium]
MRLALERIATHAIILASILLLIGNVAGAGGVSQQANTVIIIGDKPTFIEKHAAEELAKYAKQMSGCKVPIGGTPVKSSVNVIIGRAQTNHYIRDLIDSGKLNVSAQKPGLDGFVIETVKAGDVNYLVIGGSSDRGTLNAVYWLLSRVYHVGFFWGGTYVPKVERFIVPELHVSQRPRFQVREYLQIMAWTYSNMLFWDWEQCKNEIDWAAAHFQNLLNWPIPFEFWRYPIPKAMTPYQRHRMALMKRSMDYARSLGMQIVLPAKNDLIDYFGTDHVYEFCRIPSENAAKMLSEDKGDDLARVFAQAGRDDTKYMMAFDPDARFCGGGWGWVEPGYPGEAVKAYLDNVPADRFWTQDADGDERSVYKSHDGFYGRQWVFNILNSYGGTGFLHGDIAGLVKKLNDVAEDPQAASCLGTWIYPEIIHYNDLFFELAADLSWDTRQVTLDQFLMDYAVRRYGEASAPNMVRCLDELRRSVYSDGCLVSPLYQSRMGIKISSNLEQRRKYIPALRDALKYALLENNRQKNNPLYADDLVTICRMYIGDVFNVVGIDLVNAFLAREKDKACKKARHLNELMRYQEMILITRPSCRIEPMIRTALIEPSMTREERKEAEWYIKERTFTFAKYEQGWRDYNHRDMYELVKDYYGKRVKVFTDYLLRCLDEGTFFNPDDLQQPYGRIEIGWIDNPIRHTSIAPSNKAAIAAVSKVLPFVYSIEKDASSREENK